MKFELRVAFLLLYISSLHAIAILFFTRGFLLSRNELPLFSHCDDIRDAAACHNIHNNAANFSSSDADSADRKNVDCTDRPYMDNFMAWPLRAAGPPPCWTLPAVKKVVILVFDALRFDFVAPSGLSKDKLRPWMNKLQVMQKLVAEESSRAKLFKFIADPPTTSLQRLKGLTTGSLPTFIDVGNSFGAPAIVEDNIIHQLTSNGKKVIMMGDDTWLQLFPSQFARTFPFPSFNVKDLHTVDDGVIKNLFPALHENDWDVLIGHFLGVDHVGHIFGVESPHMVEKLEQYNKVVEDVISILRGQSYLGEQHDDTLLLVIGDHGQTLNGDHGGGTAEEVETALFAWSSRQLTHPSFQNCHSSCFTSLARDNEACICEFQQLDFAATLAAVLGVPFPFGSIGKVNAQLFGLVANTSLPFNYDSGSNHEEDWLTLSWLEGYGNVLRLNSWQVNRYFDQYTESAFNGFSKNDIYTLHKLYDDARTTFRESSAATESPPNLNKTLALLADEIERCTKYLNAAASLARSKWTQFSDDLMVFGLVTLFISLVIQMMTVYDLGLLDCASLHVYGEDWRKVLPLGEMMKNGLAFGIFGAIAALVISVNVSLLSTGSISFYSRQYVIAILGCAVIGTAKPYLFKRRSYATDSTVMETLDKSQQIGWPCPDFMGALAIVFCCVYACSLLSNSFILREHQVVTFLLVSIGVVDLRAAIQHKSKVPQALCFLVMNFIMRTLCEINLFKDSQYQTEKTLSKLAAPSLVRVIWQFLFLCFTTYVPLAIIAYMFVEKLWRSCSFQRSSYLWVIFFGVLLSYTAVFLHWLLDDLVNLQVLFIPASAQEFIRLQIPRTVYYVVTLQGLSLLCRLKETHTKSSSIQLKKVLEEAALPCLGLWSGLILLLLGRQGPIVTLISGIEEHEVGASPPFPKEKPNKIKDSDFCGSTSKKLQVKERNAHESRGQGWCILEKQSLYAPPQKSQVEKNVSVRYTAASIQWSLFAIQIFFCTGHRCAFDGLHYAAAFIGFDQFNIYRQGVLLALNTFGASHILPVIGLALLVTKRNPSVKDILSTNNFYRLQTSQAFLLYGLVHTLTTTFTTLCVTLQRRHLMVWGLFAPKFVFDAIGLLVTDVVLLITFLYYMLPCLR